MLCMFVYDREYLQRTDQWQRQSHCRKAKCWFWGIVDRGGAGQMATSPLTHNFSPRPTRAHKWGMASSHTSNLNSDPILFPSELTSALKLPKPDL